MPNEYENVEVVFLGTGTSHGVPMIGCDCDVCRSDDPRDHRTRPSIVVRFGGRSVLVDTAPELRLQCLRSEVRSIDAVLFTHAHADHVTGMDDLRRFNWLGGGPLDCYASVPTLKSIQNMFAYIFHDDPEYPSYKPSLNLLPIHDDPVVLFGYPVIPLPLQHGPLPVLGFRFGPLAYCTDCNEVTDAALERMSDLDLLILDGLRKRPHPTHFNLEQAVEMAGRIGARRTLFTHIAHELGHARTNAELPDGMDLAYDGQIVNCDRTN